jgi:hypothetical protein
VILPVKNARPFSGLVWNYVHGTGMSRAIYLCTEAGSAHHLSYEKVQELGKGHTPGLIWEKATRRASVLVGSESNLSYVVEQSGVRVNGNFEVQD